jgi:hypothetical protein
MEGRRRHGGRRRALEGGGRRGGLGVRWIRSYVLQEDDGTLGTYCIYEAESPEALRAHAEKAGFGAEEINVVVDTVIIRPDPVAASVAS